MQIELTESEIKTLQFYLTKALIDAKGTKAIGVNNQKTVDNLNYYGGK